MSNLPPGVSQRQIERETGFADGGRMPNSEECFLCGRQIEQDDDTGEWIPADLYYKPTVSDFLDAFETQQGWCCGSACWNDNCALNEDESIPARPVMFLVKGRTA